ncbi:nucleotidyltransferase family protein [uncultured Winogradskyella sp.]|uniref:nucleotidyltransferase family protein n=1 Tax=uncultured Winogradskyella sp. TaxID=395353 RepID=UPI002634DA19|nr:nucleotidyltransferase family protein [uncultured Winogradskyella sp.]
MNIAILILAAGSSTRMNSAKQLLPVGNTTLLGIVIENALQSDANKVYCVLGANLKAIEKSISKYSIETIFNPEYKSGLSSSIVTGIQHISNQKLDAIILLLGDQPFIKTQYINSMITSYKNHYGKIVASTYTKTYGVPAIIPKNHFDKLLMLKGDKGAKAFLNSNEQDVIPLDDANLVDIDTIEDYEELLNSKKTQ